MGYSITTITNSNVTYDDRVLDWPSRDPIEEKGGINLYLFLSDPISDFDVLGLLSGRTKALLAAACKCKKHTDETGKEMCASICCDKETGKKIITKFRKGNSGSCIPPLCPEGFKKIDDIHSHPHNNPHPSPRDKKAAKRENKQGIRWFIATGYLNSLPNVVRIVLYTGTGPKKAIYYDCKKNKIIKKP